MMHFYRQYFVTYLPEESNLLHYLLHFLDDSVNVARDTLLYNY